MPRTKISEFSATAGNNTDIDGINIGEGCAPSGINDAIRELMAQLKDFQAGTAGDSFNGPVGTTTPAAGAFTNLSASGTFALTGDQVQISEGGTGQTTANAAFNALAPSQTSNAGKYLKTDGTNTSWDAIEINTADITGTLPIANGGTGLTALGTGVQTALGQNVTGSGGIVLANSPTLVTPNLGTPSAIVLTNASGTASININGTVGATTPNMGSFTTLTTSSTVTINGGIANSVAYLNGSKVLTTGNALTFDGVNLGIGKTGATPLDMVGTFRWSSNAGGTDVWQRYSGGTGLIYDGTSTATDLAWVRGGTEGMRLTSTGLSLASTSDLTLNKGTANGVAYLNGSKVLTTGSALSFDGANFEAVNATSAQVAAVRGTQRMVIGADGITNAYVGTTTAHDVSFLRAGSEQMRLTSTGLGIGTSSPTQKLTVQGGFNQTDGTINTVLSNTAGVAIFGTATNHALTLWTNGGEKARLDSSGNLGLGVTPSAWNTNVRAFETIESWASISGNAGDGAGNVASNAFFNTSGSWTYKNTAAASRYQQLSGTHAWFTAASGTAGNAISFSQAMTLTAAGKLGVGTTGPNETIQAAGTVGSVAGSGSNGLVVGDFGADAGTYIIQAVSGRALRFYDSYAGAERARITSGGYFKASNNGTYLDSIGSFHELASDDVDDAVAVLKLTNASYTGPGAFVDISRNTTNNTFYAISYFNRGASAYKFRVADSGDVTNTNGTYGTISDAKMKTDIVDAGSQWSDIKAIRFRKFKMKDDPSGLVQLGVVAQEVELTSPGLVDEHADKDAKGNDLGTTTKSVKTSVLLMKAAVALQEAMARIEQLEAKVAALEAK